MNVCDVCRRASGWSGQPSVAIASTGDESPNVAGAKAATQALDRHFEQHLDYHGIRDWRHGALGADVFKYAATFPLIYPEVLL